MSQAPKLHDTDEMAQETADQLGVNSKTAEGDEQEDDEVEDEEADSTQNAASSSNAPKAKKKRSKKKKIKAALGLEDKEQGTQQSELEKAVGGLSKAQITEMLAMNPSLARELGVTDGNVSDTKVLEAFKKLTLQDIMTGLAADGKNVKDMASYKFWGTQPVPKFGEAREVIEEGPFKIVDPEKVPKTPAPLPDGFEWVTMDITNEEELKDVCELLSGHYVEDTASMFRLNYSQAFLKW